MISISNKWDGSPAYIPQTFRVDLKLSADALDLIISIEAPYFDDAAPPQQAGKCPKLWEHEVVSLYIASNADRIPSECPYIEIIIGPHGHYLLLAFPGEQRWAESSDEIELDEEPIVNIDRESRVWKATVLLPCCLLPEPECDAENPLALIWKANAYAMHGNGSTREYLAGNAVPGEKPNFHQLKYFTPITLFEVDPLSISLSMGSVGLKGAPVGGNIIAAATVVETSNDIKEDPNEAKNARSSMSDTGKEGSLISSEPKAQKVESLAQVAKRLSLKFSPQDIAAQNDSTGKVEATEAPVTAQIGETSKNTDSPLDEQYLRLLHEGEFPIVSGLLWKRKGWSHKKRMFILTSKPRLIYLNASGQYKGSIPWSMTTPVKVTKVDEASFDVELHDKSRVYHLNDRERGATRWVEAIEELQRAWQVYLESQIGPSSRRGGAQR